MSVNADDFSFRVADLPDDIRFSVREWKSMMTERLALLVELGLTNKSVEELEQQVDEFVDNLQPRSATDLLCSPFDPSDTSVSFEDCQRWAYKDALICQAILDWPKIDEDTFKTVLMNARAWSRYFAARAEPERRERYQEAYRDFSQMVTMWDARRQ
jgi:hypothetical protein